MNNCGCCQGCESGRCHEHEHEDGLMERLLPLRLCVAGAVLIVAVLSEYIPLYFIAYVIAGIDVVISAVKGLFKGRVFNEMFLMTLATVGAFAIKSYSEAVAVMIFYGLGEYIQDKAVDKSSDSINALIRLRPDHAWILKDGQKTSASPSEVKIGDVIAVLPGERIPLDGELLSDKAVIDTSAITGESVPRDYRAGNEILSGTINLKSEITLKVTHALEDSSTERIFRAVTEARENKSRSEEFISRFAAVYTPAVVICALILAFVPPIFLGNLSGWVHRGLIFLVASCPCALVLSVPLTYFAGIGLASRNGILFKGSVYLEQLAKLNTAAFDKTGTLTKGELEVTSIVPAEGVSEKELINAAAGAEKNSEHPIGAAIAALGGAEAEVKDFCELTGGVSAVVDGKKITAGNTALTGIESSLPGTAVHILADGKALGSIYLSDALRADAPAAVDALKKMNVECVMITGDSDSAARSTAEILGVDKVYSQVLPTQKLDIVKSLEGVTAFVGDGINDSPALSGADIGIAMGGMGREAAMEAADAVIMDDSPSKVALAVRIAKKVYNTAVFNIAFALLIKFAVLVSGALGIANMWLAVFADVGVALIAVAIAVVRCRKI